MMGEYISCVDKPALVRAARRPGSKQRYAAFVRVCEWLVTSCPDFHGKGELRPRRPAPSASALLLASRQPGSRWRDLPTPVLEQILDESFRRMQPNELKTLVPEYDDHCSPGEAPRYPSPQETALCIASRETVGHMAMQGWGPNTPCWVFIMPLSLEQVTTSHFATIQRHLGSHRDYCPLAKALVHTFQHAFPGVFTAEYEFDGSADLPITFQFRKASQGWEQGHTDVVLQWHTTISGSDSSSSNSLEDAEDAEACFNESLISWPCHSPSDSVRSFLAALEATS